MTYWPEMPQSTAMLTHSWLRSSATVRHLMRHAVLRLSLMKPMRHTALTVVAIAAKRLAAINGTTGRGQVTPTYTPPE